MIPLFSDDAQWARFSKIALSWMGTPYRHLQVAKGELGGADCTLFIGSAMVEAGYLTRLDYDYYPRDWHIHSEEEIVLESMHRHFPGLLASGLGCVFGGPETELMRGDMVAYRTPRSKRVNHTAIAWGDGRVLNAIQKRGVCWLPVSHRVLQSPMLVMRLMLDDQVREAD